MTGTGVGIGGVALTAVVTDAEGGLLQEEACQRVQDSLVKALDRRDSSRI